MSTKTEKRREVVDDEWFGLRLWWLQWWNILCIVGNESLKKNAAVNQGICSFFGRFIALVFLLLLLYCLPDATSSSSLPRVSFYCSYFLLKPYSSFCFILKVFVCVYFFQVYREVENRIRISIRQCKLCELCT